VCEPGVTEAAGVRDGHVTVVVVFDGVTRIGVDRRSNPEAPERTVMAG
jgi:hypothetical protein